MGVRPAAEWSLLLNVSEKLIEREVGDERRPFLVQGNMGKCAELEGDLRTDSSHALGAGSRFTGREARANQIQLEQPCALAGRHDPWKIVGIGEEREHTRQWRRDPMFGLKPLAHAFLPVFPEIAAAEPSE